jgi:DNA-binding transcriptional regulator YbjK
VPDGPTTRARALDAAIELLGTAGLRALTHARVDERAGLPKGSTSNWFRTRAALLAGVSDELAARDLTGVACAPEPRDAGELVDLLCAAFARMTGPDRVATTARLVLFLEASHDEALRERAQRGREVILAWAAQLFERLGARDPATAAFEGMLLHAIARHDTTDPRATYRTVVDAVLSPSSV